MQRYLERQWCDSATVIAWYLVRWRWCDNRIRNTAMTRWYYGDNATKQWRWSVFTMTMLRFLFLSSLYWFGLIDYLISVLYRIDNIFYPFNRGAIIFLSIPSLSYKTNIWGGPSDEIAKISTVSTRSTVKACYKGAGPNLIRKCWLWHHI